MLWDNRHHHHRVVWSVVWSVVWRRDARARKWWWSIANARCPSRPAIFAFQCGPSTVPIQFQNGSTYGELRPLRLSGTHQPPTIETTNHRILDRVQRRDVICSTMQISPLSTPPAAATIRRRPAAHPTPEAMPHKQANVDDDAGGAGFSLVVDAASPTPPTPRITITWPNSGGCVRRLDLHRPPEDPHTRPSLRPLLDRVESWNRGR